MIYLDNAATSWPKPSCVLLAMQRFLAEDGGSPNRAGHRLSVAAERVVRSVRTRLARLLHADDPSRVIHCFNCTDALNLAIKGAVRPGDHVITTDLDHNSILRPLQAMANADVITMTRLSVGGGGCVDPDSVRQALTPSTRLIATLHASNVTGAVQPVEAIGRIAREAGALFLVDAAQTVGLVDVDVNAMCIDLLAFPGHKALLGPPGTGGLYVSERADLSPWREGGTGGDSEYPTQPKEFPTWLEAGTPNTVGLAGLDAALAALRPADALAHLRTLTERLVDALADDRRINIVGDVPVGRSVGVVSLNIADKMPDEVAAQLNDTFDIAVRAGLHCAPCAHRALGTFPTGTVRISPGHETTPEDIDQLAAALRQIAGG